MCMRDLFCFQTFRLRGKEEEKLIRRRHGVRPSFERRSERAADAIREEL